MSNLQSSLNSDDGLGTISLSAVYVALILSSMFLPTLSVKKLGIKKTIIVAQCTYLLFIVANLYARYYTLLPAAILLGLGAAPLWIAKSKMVTDMGNHLSLLSGEPAEPIINRFFGIFFTMFQSSNIWGNIISSTVLKPQLVDENTTIALANLSVCGYNDCPGGEGIEIVKPKLSTVYLLCGIYIGSAIVGILIILIFLDSYSKIGMTSSKKIENESESPLYLLANAVRHMKNKYQLLIIPLTLWSGFEQAFIGADFTKSFVSCIKGIDSVGIVMICYGVTDALGSYFFGVVIKYVGRVPIFLLAGAANYAVIAIMMIWEPNESTTYVLYIIAVLWGLADAVWQTQINAFYGVIFKSKEEAAFSNYRLWESTGFAIAYAYSNFLCVRYKIYLLIVYLTLGLVGYGTIELSMRHSKSKDLESSQ